MRKPAYSPYAPLDVIKPVAQDVWIVDGPEIRHGSGGLTMAFPTRMTIVRLPDGGLWLHSPTAPTPALTRAVEALGPVRFLIAPNTMHYGWTPAWKERFPGAQLWAVPGVASRARRAKRTIAVDFELAAAPPPGWSAAIDQLIVAGDAIIEADFFHRPRGTLILTDLIQNLETSRVRTPFLRAVLPFSGGCHPNGSAPRAMRSTFRRQRHAVAAAAQKMIAWAPERVIIAHGRWYRNHGCRNSPRLPLGDALIGQARDVYVAAAPGAA